MLDESLYERFVATRDAPTNTDVASASLHKLWDTTFNGLRQLLWFIRSLASETKPKDPEPADDFDFGEFESPATKKEDDLALGSADLLEFLDQIEAVDDQGDQEKWATLVERVSSIEYGLSSQEHDAIERLKVALANGEIGSALGVLDDTQSSASEGVHALVTAVYEAFIPDLNPTSVVPGYLTALGRALLVRRGVAELAANLAPYNDRLQSGEVSQYDSALAAVRATLQSYVGSVVCRAMRPADRWQMVEFERQIQSEPVGVARMTTEGLVKYLDSLGSINQREVLVMHDRRTLDTMRDAVANARQLLDLSPRAAIEMMDRAYQAAQRLKGRSPSTDQLVIQLERHSPQSSNPGDQLRFLEGLEGVLAAAGG